MKSKDFAALAQRLLPELPDFEIKAPLAFIAPVSHTLRGLCFESHSYEANLFYVWVFLLPLYVPRKHVSFELGKRVGGDRWNIDAHDIVRDLGDTLKREALPFLCSIESPRDVARAAKSLQRSKDPHVQQAIAYTLARAGDMDAAVPALDELVGSLDLRFPWQHEMAERGAMLKAKLLANPADAKHQLDAWENESVRELDLEKFR